ncbi:hypothetical protein ASE36_21275 [Rhizobium sp. Root274]|uniref:hypothetical protein n=1 Tax=unclassified Rhizobium TaxID=2613769 RepID=UPI000713DCF6|nr:MULTISPECIES: hypothetical protein [unclassified Rhizobium]KQW25469.1 hypothetical protein ASC71_21335 [Rhizobium sp. Root1240]KRD26089.1 hypothetical protein ASE36_21275 [Rhizobium sp. Root274]
MMDRILVSAISAAFLAFSSPANGSSADAWAAFEAQVTKACLGASGLRNSLASTIVGFDDRAGVVAMLISDKTRGSSRSELCIYDKRAGRAFVSDAEMWSAPPQHSVQNVRPQDEVPTMIKTKRGDRRFHFANGCTVVIGRTKAIVLFADGPCKRYHEDIALLYAEDQ